MNRTRIVFFSIVLLALVIVGVSLIWRSLNQPQALTVTSRGPIQVRVITALPVEPWVRAAAKQFNAERHTLEGEPIQVEVIAMDGLAALGKWDRDEFGILGERSLEELSEAEKERLARFPTVWIPDSRYLVELANATYKERLGRDVFLTDGEYRARPLAISLFAWGIYESRAQVLQSRFGEINWKTIHDAAIAKGGWPELGGRPEWGFFKLVVPNPRKNVGGLAAMIAAAGEYYDRPDISTADVTNPDFQRWLGELMGAVTDVSGGSAYTAEDFALFGYSVGDGGQLLESDLLTNMAGIQTRWADPLRIYYPKYVTWFDFPFTVWMGPETSALEKNAALEFEYYLLSPEVQRQAVEYGLRPANPEVPVTGENSLFVRYEAQGVRPVVPRAEAMRSPDREVLLALLRWFDLNVAQR
ncbi:MAG: substrate-binding domain-containing protein [Anaerolineae bacterium]|nr:substrate-binding domain-containing protein [Anaerolineae bacterium]MDW8099105.1 substrate-binding domain-containing protein [Anaerolineae bacterium]